MNGLKYGVDDRMGPIPLLMYGVQWLLVAIPFAVIVGGIAARCHYSGDADLQTFYLQKMLIIMGITTVIQVLWGHKLPLIMGPADIMLVGVLSALAAGIEAIYTSLMIGGAILTIASFSGILRKAQKLFTIRVVVTILFLISLSLTPAISDLIYDSEGQPQLKLVFALVTALLMFSASRVLPGIWKSMTVLLGMLIGTGVYFAVYGLPAAPAVNGTFGLQIQGLFLSSFDFNIGTLLAFMICYVALFVNELSSVEAAGQLFNADNMEKRTGRAMKIFGASNMLSGFGGVLGSVDYTISLGVISATGCASRFPIVPAGIGLTVFALFPQAIVMMTLVPGAVMAAVLLYLLTAIIGSAFSLLVREKAISSFDSGLVIGLPLMVAIMVAFTPEEVIAHSPELLKPIIGNAFVVSTMLAMLLEHVLLKEK